MPLDAARPGSGVVDTAGVRNRLKPHLVRDEGVAGSNPATPTSFLKPASITGPDMGNETPCRPLPSDSLTSSGYGAPDAMRRLCLPERS
jgi:hypothetical protein